MSEKCEYCGGLGEHMGADGVPIVCGYCDRTGKKPEPRADTDKPGTSKVQDMRRLAVEAVGE